MALSIQELLDNAEKAAGNSSSKLSMGITTCCQPYTLEVGIFFDGTFNYDVVDLKQEEKDKEWGKEQEQRYKEEKEASAIAKYEVETAHQRWQDKEYAAADAKHQYVTAVKSHKQVLERLATIHARVLSCETHKQRNAVLSDYKSQQADAQESAQGVERARLQAHQAQVEIEQTQRAYKHAKIKYETVQEGVVASKASPGQSSSTNISKLRTLYPRTEGDLQTLMTTGKKQYERVYVRGVGALEDAESPADHSSIGGGTGLIVESGYDRIIQAKEELQSILRARKNCMPTMVCLDIFGFSRGAALARHFANALQDGLPDYSMSLEFDTTSGLIGELRREREQDLKKYPKLPNVKIRFIGLFDTVGSFGLPGNSLEAGIKLDLPQGCANNVYHLVAAHERRKNFRFTSVQPGWEEDFIAGVHADIGGGYRYSELTYLLMDAVEGFMVNHTAAYTQLQKQAAARGDAQADGTLLPGWHVAIASADDSTRKGTLLLLRPKVTSNAYAHVPLHIMLNKAVAVEVPFNKDIATSRYPIPAELAHLEAASQASLPIELWEKYIHVSATGLLPEVPYAAMPRTRYEPDAIGMNLDSGSARKGFLNSDSWFNSSSPYPQTSSAGYDVEGVVNSEAIDTRLSSF